MREYALYKGDKLLAIGTVREIARQTNVKPDTIFYYKTPSYRKRMKNKNPDNIRTMVYLGEGENDE